MVSANLITICEIFTWSFVASSLRHHSIRCARSCPLFDTQGSHRVLQHCAVVRGQSFLAISLERHHPVSSEGCGMLRHECLGYGCEWWHHARSVLRIRSLNVELLQIVALSDGVGMRLLGISIASFSTGLFDIGSSRLRLKMAAARSRWAHLLATIHYIRVGHRGA